MKPRYALSWFLLSSFCVFIPGMNPSRRVCSIYYRGKMPRDMTGKWQIAIHEVAGVLQRFDCAVSEAAEWLRCLPEVSAAEMKQTSGPESVSTQTAENADTLSPGSTQQLFCYCSLHPSENRIKLLGKLYYAIACWNTQEATVYVSVCVCWTVKSKYRDSGAITHSYGCRFSTPDHPSVLRALQVCWLYQSTGADASGLQKHSSCMMYIIQQTSICWIVCWRPRSCLGRKRRFFRHHCLCSCMRSFKQGFVFW